MTFNFLKAHFFFYLCHYTTTRQYWFILFQIESSTTKCTEVCTLEPVEGARVEVVQVSGGKAARNIPKGSVLTRRLGLIVGITMGGFVFVILVGCLSYLKIKKRRSMKTDDTIGPQEYITYDRALSFQSTDPAHSNMGTTDTLIGS